MSEKRKICLPESIFILLFFIFCLQSLNSLEITEKEAGGYFRGAFTRSNDYLNEISTIGLIELDDKYTFKGGLSLGRTIVDTDINSFLNVKYSPFENIPLGFSVSYIYNGFPEYETHANSIFPFVSWDGQRMGVSAGCNFRFTRFFRESAQFESILSFNVYLNFINNDKLCFGLGFGNFDDFHANNLASFSPKLYAVIRFDSNWHLINDIEIMQSGADGLTTTLYGVSFRTGAKYSW